MRTLKTVFLLAGLLAFSVTALAQPYLHWAKEIGDVGTEEVRGVVTDASGNVYTTGYFYGTLDFDPGPGTTTLTAVGQSDIFLQKLDAAGNLLWVKSMGGADYDFGNAITIDATGNLYVTGAFQTTADFDPGAVTTNLVSAGDYDVFVAKLDANGTLLWARGMGGANYSTASAITVDASGNVYTTGSFWSSGDFDPGAGTVTLTSAGITDVFLSKLDASGNYVWAKAMGGTGQDESYSLALDASGNVYTTGYFNGTVDFDPGAGTATRTAAGSADIFVSKLNTSGTYVWAKSFGGASDDMGQSITVDGSGNVYTVGKFQGTVDFDPGAGTVNRTSAGNTDLFTLKLDASGNYLWAHGMGDTGYDQGKVVTVDGSGNVYTTGIFSGTVDFDPGAGTFNLSSSGGTDMYIAKYSAAGNFLWAGAIGGYNDSPSALVLDATGNLYVSGYFQGTGDFNPGTGVYTLTGPGSTDIFLVKVSETIPLPLTLVSFTATSTAGAVQLQWKTVFEQNTARFEVERSRDGRHFETIAMVAAAGNSSSERSYQCLDGQPLTPAGYYRLKMVDVDHSVRYSLVVLVRPDSKQKLVAFPNPAGSVINVSLNNRQATEIHLQDMAGITVRKIPVAQQGQVTTAIDLSGLPTGVYLLKAAGETIRILKL